MKTIAIDELKDDAGDKSFSSYDQFLVTPAWHQSVSLVLEEYTRLYQRYNGFRAPCVACGFLSCTF